MINYSQRTWLRIDGIDRAYSFYYIRDMIFIFLYDTLTSAYFWDSGSEILEIGVLGKITLLNKRK